MIIQIQEDENGELFIQFPEKMMNDLGWMPDDTLIWNVEKNGTITLVKKEQELINE
jgi:hypothetical protein